MNEKNIVQLRNDLGDLFEQIRAGGIEPRVASEMNNSAGKILNSLRVELEYAALRKEKPTISYLEGE